MTKPAPFPSLAPREPPPRMLTTRIVVVTWAPSPMAPENSHTDAMSSACLMVMARDPTEDPKALATSFAPMPYAVIKDSTAPSPTIQV